MIVSTDPIADMLTRIRNAIMVRKTSVSLPYSEIKKSIADLLVANNFIDSAEVNGEGIDKEIIIQINSEDANANISCIERISKPGRRHYVNVKNIPTVKRGRGIVIMSTSKGLMTGDQARSSRLGGELVCKVY